MKVYVASSWRNEGQPLLVKMLRGAGHEVYDFRNPHPGNTGFAWSDIDPNWQHWTPEEFKRALRHPLAVHGLNCDYSGLALCDVLVMLQPCGRSASLELGWAIGAGKETIILLDEGQEPELMFGLAGRQCLTADAVIQALRDLEEYRSPPSTRPVSIFQWQNKAHATTKGNGFHSGESNIYTIIGNLMAEAAECWDAIRKPDFIPGHIYYRQDGKPEGLGIELADVVLRALDAAEELGIDLEYCVRIKDDFNGTRVHRHGKRI